MYSCLFVIMIFYLQFILGDGFKKDGFNSNGNSLKEKKKKKGVRGKFKLYIIVVNNIFVGFYWGGGCDYILILSF